MAVILYVRVKSDLDPEELERRVIERRPRFKEVPGLVQKIYARDDSTGDVCGIYFFEDQQALANFRDTELAKSIPSAYEAKEVRREVYEMLYPLHPERGTDYGVNNCLYITGQAASHRCLPGMANLEEGSLCRPWNHTIHQTTSRREFWQAYAQ